MTHSLTSITTLTVLGLSKSGEAVAAYAASQGIEVFLSEMLPGSDGNREQRARLAQLGIQIEMGGHSQQCFNHSHYVVVSPGIPPTSSMVEQLLMSEKTVMSEVEYAWRNAQTLSQPPRWIGITGTNGKTTTVTGIDHILHRAGLSSVACGNIGLPVTNCITTHAEAAFWVVELSSFQLHFSPTLTPYIAVFLNLTPDHINWHGSFEAYKKAKMSLYLPKPDGDAPQWLVLNADDPVSAEIDALASPQSNRVWFSRLHSQKPAIPDAASYALWLDGEGNIIGRWNNQPLSGEYLLNVNAALLKGAHNHENILAMVGAALAANVSADAIRGACLAFTGVEHRLEPVTLPAGSHNITVINDSKATNVNSTLAALEAFSGQPVVLVIGGRLKNEPLTPLVEAAKVHAKGVVLYGEGAYALLEAFNQTHYSGVIQQAAALSDAVVLAYGQAKGLQQESDLSPVLLFSPAAASFDQFKDFDARGTAFKQLIRQLVLSDSAQQWEVQA